MAFSPRQALAGATVLLTGGFGFLGSVCLEQLLRLTEVRKVYLLARSKRDLSPNQRLEKLLAGPLFNLLHKDASSGIRNVFNKVQTLDGDMLLPGCGLSEEDLEILRSETTIIIHCAADLTLDAEIQKTLRSNYCGTRELLSLATGMTHLKSFLFTSTYYVNNYLPRNSPAKEKVHDLPLTLPGIKYDLDHSQLVDILLSLPPEEADRQAADLMHRLNFTSTYAFGKLLTEHLVNEFEIPGVGKVVVRPSLISGIAGEPYRGYVSGYAGAPGWAMGYAAGFFSSTSGMALASDYIMDLIPCDTVAALVIAAAAAAASEADQGAAAAAAKLYHAASAESYPLLVCNTVSQMALFWSANPPPLRVPLTGYVTYHGDHFPTPEGLEKSRKITYLKIWALVKILELSGRPREAKALNNGFKAFCVQNSFAYNKSIKSCVDNGRSLWMSINEKERSWWPVVWDGSLMDWDEYGFTFLASIRALLYRMKGPVRTPKPHYFELKPSLTDSAQLHKWMTQPSSSHSESVTESSELLTAKPHFFELKPSLTDTALFPKLCSA